MREIFYTYAEGIKIFVFNFKMWCFALCLPVHFLGKLTVRWKFQRMCIENSQLNSRIIKTQILFPDTSVYPFNFQVSWSLSTIFRLLLLSGSFNKKRVQFYTQNSIDALWRELINPNIEWWSTIISSWSAAIWSACNWLITKSSIHLLCVEIVLKTSWLYYH
jgi:hypothetical protein